MYLDIVRRLVTLQRTEIIEDYVEIVDHKQNLYNSATMSLPRDGVQFTILLVYRI